MLSTEIRAKIQADREHYPEPRAACIEAMKMVQREHGWVNDEHLREIAGLLDMSVADLDGVATFFNQIYRKPVGKNVILLCDSITCYMLGHEQVQNSITKCLGIKPGQTSADKQFTLIPTQCLGCCDHAPALMVNDDLHHDVDPDQMETLLSRYRG